jgi:hypothetical protein
MIVRNVGELVPSAQHYNSEDHNVHIKFPFIITGSWKSGDSLIYDFIQFRRGKSRVRDPMR